MSGIVLLWQNNGPFLGVCPAGGQHSANPSAPYVVPFGDNLSFRTRRWLYKQYGRLGHTLFSWDEIRHDSYVFMSAAEATDSANPPDRFTGKVKSISSGTTNKIKYLSHNRRERKSPGVTFRVTAAVKSLPGIFDIRRQLPFVRRKIAIS